MEVNTASPLPASSISVLIETLPHQSTASKEPSTGVPSPTCRRTKPLASLVAVWVSLYKRGWASECDGNSR
ncbi:hypothetical protein [Barnesiella intestinihominis]|uniref:hypothetical protein n=1 Tax=Barnesiella intestinihominis TaxID=487174 RepID=UPI00265A459D|nr:hypothetical protein [Barnesiella intestinihominis]